MEGGYLAMAKQSQKGTPSKAKKGEVDKKATASRGCKARKKS